MWPSARGIRGWSNGAGPEWTAYGPRFGGPYQAALDAKEGALDEQTQRYRDIRHVLTHLVTNMPGVPDRTRPGTALRATHAYLYGHCAECGATLERHDYALVHAQEMVRIGTAAASDVAELPICPDCYVVRCAVRQQFAPVDAPEQG